jgi:ATP-dependent DNA helicase RecG
MRQLDLFSALQSSTEGIDTEFKSARGGMPGSFWESYAAMDNTHGTIVLGVADAAQLRNLLP